MPQPHERRQEERAPIELRVEYQRLNRFFYDYTKNISKGGTFIQTTKPLDVGTQFLFKLLVPNNDEPMVLLGEVRWVLHEGETRHNDDGSEVNTPGMGIRFIYKDVDQQEQVEREVEKLMVSSLGPRIYARLHDMGDKHEE
ncbi:MAG: TIGR02266 family protein [Polyangia bacterium]|jgi:type IV pilus assembly protein PilZ